jgi:hypothetical protein
MKKTALFLFLAFIGMTAFQNTGFAQKKTINKKVVSKVYESNRGTDPNIKSVAPTTDVRATKSRGATCQIYFQNSSGLYVEIYVDGSYYGTLVPNGAMNVYVDSGYTTIYCVSSGRTRYWNDSGNCNGYYRYNLTY